MGGYQNYGPLLGPLTARCRTIPRTQQGTLILTTTHMVVGRSIDHGADQHPMFFPSPGAPWIRQAVSRRLCMWVVVKIIMVTFWILNVTRHLIFRGPKRGP